MKINILSVCVDGIPYAYPFTGDKLGLLKSWVAKAKDILGDRVVGKTVYRSKKEIDGPIKFDQDIF